MDIRLIGVPLDLGANRRGVDMGPSALRYAGLQKALTDLGHRVTDTGNLIVPGPEQVVPGPDRARYLSAIVDVCSELARHVANIRSEGGLPVVLGGDHSLSIGSVGGLLRSGEDVGVLWLDAHGDFNTPATTPSGNIHGMTLAALTGRGAQELVACTGTEPLAPERIVMIGVRDLDPEERLLIQDAGVIVYTMQEVDRLGMPAVMEKALGQLKKTARTIHVSLDMDVFEPDLAPGVGTPKGGGFTYREGHLAMEMIAETNMLVGLDIVEVNPILDKANRTARLAVDMARSALGARVL